MRLFVETMDVVLVEFNQHGKVRFDGEEWSVPTLQERRAILYAAQNQVNELQELIQSLDEVSPL